MPRYQVIVTGFRCNTETRDNIFELDGKRDEIELRAAVTIRHPDGSVTTADASSALMGDTWRLPGRVQVGTASNLGGIRTGDGYPSPQTPWSYSGSLSPLRVPPWKVWEGDLEPGGDTAEIGITVWEIDAATSQWEGWRELLAKTDDRYGKQAQDAFGKIWPAASPVFPVVSVIIQTANSFTGLWGAYKELTRPVGLQKDPSQGPDGAKLDPMHLLILNAQTAAEAVKLDVGGFSQPGTRELRYKDDPWLGGDYSLYVLVREVPGAGTPAPTATSFTDGITVRETSDPRVYVMFGGAKFWVPSPADLNRLYGGFGVVQIVSDGALNNVPDALPRNNTMLREDGSAYVWLIEGGRRHHVTTPSDVNFLGGWNRVGIVPRDSLALMATGPAYRRPRLRELGT